jgi:hypothetical protein
MNELLKNLKSQANVTRTTNGATTYKSTLNKVYDLFAQGAAMRGAADNDCVYLFKEAYEEDATLALKCLFWMRDIRGGAGERRFFRLCIKWLAMNHKDEMVHLIPFVTEYGRWDDLFELFNTPCEGEMLGYVKWAIDKNEDHLLYKWMPSINTSSRNTQERGRKFAREFGMTERQYRKMLSEGRKACHLVETLMSQQQWDQIAFDKLPSRAGILYSKAFARREETKDRYAEFMRNEKTKVNAGTLYPYDVVAKAIDAMHINNYNYYYTRRDIALDDTDRLAANKYWDNLKDYFDGATLNALCVCDTSGSMTSGYYSKIAPIDVAISIALYTAERAAGPFHGHYISFSSRPQLIETTGVDFCDKVARIYKTNLCENTNIEATFNLILNTAINCNLTQDQLPESLIVISDMQFDAGRGAWTRDHYGETRYETLMEGIERKWKHAGYKMPKLIYWNVNAASGGGNIPMQDKDGVTFVSGASPAIFTSIMTGKTGMDLMLEAITAPRYNAIKSIKG